MLDSNIAINYILFAGSPLDPTRETALHTITKGRGWIMSSRSSGYAIVAVIAVMFGLMQARTRAADSYLLSLSGTFDGSDSISVSPNSATWTHLSWAQPAGVELNGQSWANTINPIFTSATPMIPSSLTGYALRVRRFSGRDMSAAQIQGNTVNLLVDDTPLGEALYNFNVALIPEVPVAVSTTATLTFSAPIDGGDNVFINSAGAAWNHTTFTEPTTAQIGGVTWNPTTTPFLPNSGATQFLPAGVSFQNVTLQQTSGRDIAALDTFGDHIAVYFRDNPNGADNYSVSLTFSGIGYRAPAPGDANSDGSVDFNDLLTIENHYNTSGQTWMQGDFDIDGQVNFNDLLLWAENYTGGPLTGDQTSQLDPSFDSQVQLAMSEAPEPCALALLPIASVLILRRRKRATADVG